MDEKKKKGFFKKFEFGEYSLAFAFWVGFPLFIFTTLATGLLTFAVGIPKALWAIFIFLPLFILFLRGLWNSASNSKGSKVWVVLAKAFVLIYAALVVLNTLGGIFI